MNTRRWREWSEDERMRSRARAAYLFMNIVHCRDCGLDWPEGLVHEGCVGPLPESPVAEYQTAASVLAVPPDVESLFTAIRQAETDLVVGSETAEAVQVFADAVALAFRERGFLDELQMAVDRQTGA